MNYCAIPSCHPKRIPSKGRFNVQLATCNCLLPWHPTPDSCFFIRGLKRIDTDKKGKNNLTTEIHRSQIKLIISYHELTRIETDKECTAKNAEHAEEQINTKH